MDSPGGGSDTDYSDEDEDSSSGRLLVAVAPAPDGPVQLTVDKTLRLARRSLWLLLLETFSGGVVLAVLFALRLSHPAAQVLRALALFLGAALLSSFALIATLRWRRLPRPILALETVYSVLFGPCKFAVLSCLD